MNTNDDDADLERVEFDFSRAKLVNQPSSPDGFGIVIDGAVGYSLRLIPSNKILGRFASTHEAWPAVLAEIERGIPAKCLVLDWHWANGRRGRVSSGRNLIFTAGQDWGCPPTTCAPPAESLAGPWRRSRASSRMIGTMLRIRSARALDGYRVRLTLTDGETVERDLTDIIWGPVFQPLLDDYGRFRQVQVEAGTLTWPGDLDFDPDTLIWGGEPPSEPGSRPLRFLRLPRRTSSAA